MYDKSLIDIGASTPSLSLKKGSVYLGHNA